MSSIHIPIHDEYGNAISSYAGGLRIYSIQCRDVEGTLKNERRFLYEKDGIPTGYAPQVTFVDEMEKLYLRTYSRTSMRYRLYSSCRWPMPVLQRESLSYILM